MDSGATVRAAYEAFLRGDMESLLAAVADNVEWIDPVFGRFSGRDGVRDFFARLDRTFQLDRFDVQDYIAQGDTVVVLGAERARARTTGHSYDSAWAHVVRLRDGKIASLQIYMDSDAAMSVLGETPAERAAALGPMGVTRPPFSERADKPSDL